MKNLSRRALLSSIASSVLFAANPVRAASCDVTRSRKDGVALKTYSCRMGEDISLSATFVRMSDIVADTFRDQQLPSAYESILKNSRLIENAPLATLEALSSRFSYPIELPYIDISIEGLLKPNRIESITNSSRLRTMGVWDDNRYETLPFFPLPDELRRAFSSSPSNFSESSDFLRYATPEDFQELDRKKSEYINLWASSSYPETEDAHLSHMGNLDLMEFIQAGSVNNFFPLYFYSVSNVGCGGTLHGGAHYVPPALFVDAVICENTGSTAFKIDDFFGAGDETRYLRTYLPSTPEGTVSLGWQNIELLPGERIVAIQRLIFGADNTYGQFGDPSRSFAKAVFGPTQLPKGVIIDGQSFAFDGRSHNVLIVTASYSEDTSCPYLLSWCEQANEWVELGKVITECNSAALEGEEIRSFDELRLKFKLVEREHERTFIRALSLEIETHNGTVFQVSSSTPLNDKTPEWPVILEIGRMFEFEFDLPDGLRAKDVSKTKLRIRGYYEKYTQQDFEDRKRVALAEA